MTAGGISRLPSFGVLHLRSIAIASKKLEHKNTNDRPTKLEGNKGVKLIIWIVALLNLQMNEKECTKLT